MSFLFRVHDSLTKHNKMKSLKNILVIAALLGGLTVLVGCKKGPMEKAGEKIDNAAEKTGDALKDAGEKTKDAVTK